MWKSYSSWWLSCHCDLVNIECIVDNTSSYNFRCLDRRFQGLIPSELVRWGNKGYLTCQWIRPRFQKGSKCVSVFDSFTGRSQQSNAKITLIMCIKRAPEPCANKHQSPLIYSDTKDHFRIYWQILVSSERSPRIFKDVLTLSKE